MFLRSEPNETEYTDDEAKSDENTEHNPNPKRRKVIIDVIVIQLPFFSIPCEFPTNYPN